jgi:hypothetical protein
MIELIKFFLSVKNISGILIVDDIKNAMFIIHNIVTINLSVSLKVAISVFRIGRIDFVHKGPYIKYPTTPVIM